MSPSRDPESRSVPHMSAEEFRRRGHELVDWIAAYLGSVEQRPVMSRVAPGDLVRALPSNPPERGEPWSAVVADLDRLIVPALTHWQSPNFFAYFPANASEPAVLAELLSAGLGVNGFLWQTSPAITELEMVMLDWLASMLGLPPAFTFRGGGGAGGGVIHGTASEATLTALVAARERARAGGGPNSAFTAYASTQAHSSVVKAAMIAGLGREGTRLIDVDGRLAMRPDLLALAVERDRRAGLTPAFVCATVGTTSTGAIDPLRAIGEVCRREALWLHVDAAYAGAACVCPEHRSMLDGAELCDSFSFNPHKWLLTNFDCAAFWTRDRAALVRSLSITPEYLRTAASDSGAAIDYRDWQVPLGRRFRSLKLWFVIRHYGVEGLRAHIRHQVSLAERFEAHVRADARFELPLPRSLGLVCFRVRGSDERNRALADSVNRAGRLMITPTVVPLGDPSLGRTERVVLRLALGATRVEARHVDAAWRELSATASVPSEQP